MLARVGFAIVVLMAMGGLAGAATLAQSPTPTSIPVGCDFPTPTPGPGETPYPGSTATAAPAAPTDLRAELVADPELASGPAVQLSWQDNADNETCYQLMVRIDGEPLRAHGGFVPYDSSTTGPQTLKDIPERTGLHCYQVYYGNGAGRSYSNEACIDVQAVPVIVTPTPPTGTMTPVSGSRPEWPPACDGKGPIGSPGSPRPPTGLQAELVQDSTVLEGFVVRLEWFDNADNEACHMFERKIGAEDWAVQSGSGPSDPWNTGPIFIHDIPQQLGTHCYRIFYANEAGRSDYSNEACVEVKVLPTLLAPTPPPWSCSPPDVPPYSELGPTAPTDLQAIQVWDAAMGGGLRVDLAWQDNATDELCWGFERRGMDGTWQWIGGGGEGAASTAIDSQPFLGDGCYRVWVANENGRSAYSNEACATGPAVTVTPTPITTPTPSTPVMPLVPPVLGVGGHDSTGLPWWVLTAAASALFLGLSALSLVAARGRR